MSVYKWPIEIIEYDGYYGAQFRGIREGGFFGTGKTRGEAIKELKQVRREFIHWFEVDRDDPKWWRPLTTNGRSK